MPSSKTQTGFTEEEHTRFRLYAAVVMIFLFIGVIFLIIPKGSYLSQCMGVVINTQKEACLYSLAASSSNSSVCNYIPGSLANSCYVNVALHEKSAAACGLVRNNTTASSGCVIQIANTTGNFMLCENLSQQYANACNADIAMASANVSLCSRVSNASMQSVCGSSINVNKAIISGRTSYCLNVTNTTNKTTIQEIISKTSSVQNKIGVGDLVNTSTAYYLNYVMLLPNESGNARDTCYILVAAETQNRTACKSVSSKLLSNLCYYNVGGKTNSSLEYNTSTNFTTALNSCKSAGTYASFCTQSILIAKAIVTENSTICSTMQSDIGDQCYTSIADHYQNSTYCGYITNSSMNSACLMSLTYNKTT